MLFLILYADKIDNRCRQPSGFVSHEFTGGFERSVLTGFQIWAKKSEKSQTLYTVAPIFRM